MTCHNKYNNDVSRTYTYTKAALELPNAGKLLFIQWMDETKDKIQSIESGEKQKENKRVGVHSSYVCVYIFVFRTVRVEYSTMLRALPSD